MATALEAKGWCLDDPLWSAKLLIDAPHAIREVHEEFLRAGADCITSASYQASLAGFAARGLSRTESRALLTASVQLAVDARDGFWARAAHREGRRRPLVAASVGPYGAYLADGSEYTGAYAVDEHVLEHFHRERWALLAASPADVLACETIPSGAEVSVLLRLLRETPDRLAWLSVSCADDATLCDGTPIAHVAECCDSAQNLVAVGVNCVEPALVGPLLRALGRVTSKPLIAYPNAGETYDPSARRWREDSTPITAEHVREWVAAGARIVGGCCRVGPEQIRALRAATTRD